MKKLALIKLGGSVVTFKDKPLAPNVEAIDRISKALKKLDGPCMIVHGGGSFGHYWSVQYNMHTRPSEYDVHGISVVHESMVALNQVIVNSMIKAGLNPYGIPPSTFTSRHRPISPKLKSLAAMARSGVMPVTFGDVVHIQGAKYSILSGDSLMTIIAGILRPSRVIFATNVDGIYGDPDTKKVVRRIGTIARGRIKLAEGSMMDVTGGMKRKITEAFKIARSGMDVMMVNGLFPERIVDAVEGRPTTGTLISKKGGS